MSESSNIVPTSGWWRTSQGFTLIELMVVVSIIALLISILLPVLSQTRAAARATQCASNQRQVAMVSTVYATDYQEIIPPAYYAPTGGIWLGWYDHLFSHLNREPLRNGRFGLAARGHVLDCPTHERGDTVESSFGANAAAGYGDSLANVYLPQGVLYPYVVLGTRPRSSPWPMSQVAWYLDSRESTYFRTRTGDRPQFFYVDWRHQEAANVVFMDGHVKRWASQGLHLDANLIDGSDEWKRFFGRLP